MSNRAAPFSSTRTVQWMEQIDREHDGVDHIRIGHLARTRLGRLLANSAHTPFALNLGMEIGIKSFASLEAFWLWNCSGRINDSLCALDGGEARRRRDRVVRVRPSRRTFRGEVCAALQAKILQTPELQELLMAHRDRAPRLPFVRYECMGDTAVLEEGQPWFIEFLDEMVTSHLPARPRVAKPSCVDD